MIGHEALAQLCISHFARFSLLRLHYPHEAYWCSDAGDDETKDLPTYQISPVGSAHLHPGQVDAPPGEAIRVQQLGRAMPGAGFMLPMGSSSTSDGDNPRSGDKGRVR